jgi:hypothetical protein
MMSSINSSNKKIDTDSPYRTPLSLPPQNHHLNNIRNIYSNSSNSNDIEEEEPQLNNISKNYLILNQLNQKQQRLQQQKQQEKLQQQKKHLNNDQLEYYNSKNYIINCTTQYPKSEVIAQIDDSNNFLNNNNNNDSVYNNINMKKIQKIKPSYIQSVYEMDQKILRKVRLFLYLSNINYSFFYHTVYAENIKLI